MFSVRIKNNIFYPLILPIELFLVLRLNIHNKIDFILHNVFRSFHPIYNEVKIAQKRNKFFFHYMCQCIYGLYLRNHIYIKHIQTVEQWTTAELSYYYPVK